MGQLKAMQKAQGKSVSQSVADEVLGVSEQLKQLEKKQATAKASGSAADKDVSAAEKRLAADVASSLLADFQQEENTARIEGVLHPNLKKKALAAVKAKAKVLAKADATQKKAAATPKAAAPKAAASKAATPKAAAHDKAKPASKAAPKAHAKAEPKHVKAKATTHKAAVHKHAAAHKHVAAKHATAKK